MATATFHCIGVPTPLCVVSAAARRHTAGARTSGGKITYKTSPENDQAVRSCVRGGLITRRAAGVQVAPVPLGRFPSPRPRQPLRASHRSAAAVSVADTAEGGSPFSLSAADVVRELLAGITVALTLIPETLAFALVVGVNPMLGIHTTALAAALTSLAGGRPSMLSGAAGALAVVSCALVKSHGIEYLFASVFLMGLIQFAAATLRLGRFAVLIPRSVVLGFVSGLAVVIGRSQIHHFQVLQGPALATFCALVASGMALISVVPKVTKRIPPSLVAVVALTAAVQVLGVSTLSVSDVAKITFMLPSLHLPQVPMTLEMVKVILPYSAIMAAIGLVETVLTMQVVDESTSSTGDFNRENVAQAATNMLGGLMCNQGACAMIVPSNLNVESGGKTRLSGFFCGAAVLASVLVPQFIGAIPLAGLVAVLLTVCAHTFAWSAWRTAPSSPAGDVAVMAVVTFITVMKDLATAFGAGCLLSAIIFAWQMAHTVSVKKESSSRLVVAGPLFFGSVGSLKSAVASLEESAGVTLDMTTSRVLDLSAAHALQEFTMGGRRTVSMENLDSHSRELLERAGAAVPVAEGSPVDILTPPSGLH